MENVDYALLGFSLFSALLTGAFIIYVWTNEEEEKMNKILTKIFGDAGVGIVDKLAGVADRFIRTKDEKAKFQKEMEQIWIQAESDMQKKCY